jgi:hypothetical protein
MLSWLKKMKTDHEASTRCFTRCRPPSPPPAALLCQLPPALRLQDYIMRPVLPRQERDYRYVPREECEALWEANESVDHPDALAPHPCQGAGHAAIRGRPKLDAEMRRRVQNLPEAMRCDRMYENRQFWYDFLALEHTVHQRSTFHSEY